MIDKYVAQFKHLNSDRSPARWTVLTNYRAPHKPLLLLAIMDRFAEGVITTNSIEPTAELVELFTLYWSVFQRSIPFKPLDRSRQTRTFRVTC